MREQVEALEHHRHLRADGHNGRRVGVDQLAIDRDAPGVVALKPVDAAQDGGFAGTGRADHAHDFALGDFGVDALEHLKRAEALADSFELDHFVALLFSRCRTSRISGTHITRYISATSENTVAFLNVETAISLPCRASSATVMVEA
ncbi:hypothetical protein G6F40_017119 [Rhizopus arrhizus]|nr:hypothetical protein G6F40_017119 [Rhizopus arrhizus]